MGVASPQHAGTTQSEEDAASRSCSGGPGGGEMADSGTHFAPIGTASTRSTNRLASVRDFTLSGGPKSFMLHDFLSSAIVLVPMTSSESFSRCVVVVDAVRLK